jgi:hypothetical protein
MRRTIRTIVLLAVVSVAVLGVETGRADEGVTTTVGAQWELRGAVARRDLGRTPSHFSAFPPPRGRPGRNSHCAPTRTKKRGRPEAASLDCGEMTARS